MRLDWLELFLSVTMLLGAVSQSPCLIMLLYISLIGFSELLTRLAKIRAKRVEKAFFDSGASLVCALACCFEKWIQSLCSLLKLLITFATRVT